MHLQIARFEKKHDKCRDEATPNQPPQESRHSKESPHSKESSHSQESRYSQDVQDCLDAKKRKSSGMSNMPKLETAGQNARNLLQKASGMINTSGPIPQIVIGATTGWATGFLSTKIGKTAALSIGGSILLVTVATQTGYVRINWDKVTEKTEQAPDKAREWIKRSAHSEPAANLGQFARRNKYFAAGFLGGFLLGMCS